MSKLVSEISAVIPTYCREQVLVETIEQILANEPAPAELLVIDQLPAHGPDVTGSLSSLERAGKIRWLRLDRASIPYAMNVGLQESRSDLVLFVDDDIIPAGELVVEHVRAHQIEGTELVAGSVIQPWGPAGLASGQRVPSGSDLGDYRWVREFMGGNFSVKRSRAIEVGGFDENFVGAGYRYEAEFAGRLIAGGGRILYAPAAQIHHLKASEGGTRTSGDHFRTFRPTHSVGAYYHLLKGIGVERRWRRLILRPFAAVCTRFHLRHPWWIPVGVVTEAAGLVWAILLLVRGPKYLGPAQEARS